MKLIRDNRIIEATDKAYNVIYKSQGYIPYVETKLEDLTKAQIIEKLEEKNIDHNPTDLKKELLELLGSDK